MMSLLICTQLVLEKIAPAIGGMLFMVGSGVHIAQEFGWMVSKGMHVSR
jgi:hypothetical protein